jgi:hypothetical protein
MAYPKSVDDGLCNPRLTIPARQLLGLVCRIGGADCPLLTAERAAELLAVLGRDPAAAIRLVSDVDEVPHYTALSDADFARVDREALLNRKRDLDVLQRLGLVPGDTRRARYLYELLFERIATPNGICAFDTPGWEGCALARSGAYESVREKGWSAVVYIRPEGERADFRRRNVEQIERADRLFIRSHHLMCIACAYAGGEGGGPRPNDTIYEVLQRIERDPDIQITLIEGTCQVCDCCDGFVPENGRCVHGGGLIRDYKKDLDCFQKLGLWPGDTLPARELFALLFERIPSTRDVCAYGDGIVRSNEWSICGGPEGNPAYEVSRARGMFRGFSPRAT